MSRLFLLEDDPGLVRGLLLSFSGRDIPWRWREVCTSVFSGIAVGCVFGLPLSFFLQRTLVTRYFGSPWQVPAIPWRLSSSLTC